MRNIRAKTGPVKQRPVFELHEIENTCVVELRKADLLPTTPSPVRIDRFIEKRFGINEIYEDIGSSILGYTVFGPRGVEAIFVSKTLDEEGTTSAARRVRSTLAHEAGHGLLHAHLFAGGKPCELISEGGKTEPKILCRDPAGGYDGRWWEFQANKAIGALLMPMHLVEQALRPLFGTGLLISMPDTLDTTLREQAKHLLSDTFDVNPVVAELRLQDRWPLTREQK